MSSMISGRSHFPILHSYKVNGAMAFARSPALPLRFPSKSPLCSKLPKLPRLIYPIRPGYASKAPNFTVRAAGKFPETPIKPSSDNTTVIIFSFATTVALAVANRVLHKLALAPMKHYPFFLALFTTFWYVVVYFPILYVRYRAGIVGNDMLSLPKFWFAAIGLLEALAFATTTAAAAMLPGPAIPILSQISLVWQMIFSFLLLERTYSFNQAIGCLLAFIGAAVAFSGGSNANQMLSGVELIWPVVMILSSAFYAGSAIIKELVFVNAEKQLSGRSLDIFVLKSFGSAFQALFVLLLLPFLLKLQRIPFTQFPSYLENGVGCFLNVGAKVQGCEGAPLLPLLYIAANMAFNVSMLHVTKNSSAVISSIAVRMAGPISVFVLSLPLPYLPRGSSLSPLFLLGTGILMSGLVLYTIPPSTKRASQ